MTVRLGLTGDVMLGRLVDERQSRRDPGAVWGTMLESLRACDQLFINLECCLSRRGEPWTRPPRRFHFRANPDWAIPALKLAGVDACALANNHILDFEELALADTLDALDMAGIARSGAGRTLDEALAPTVVVHGDLTVAMISLTDNVPAYAANETSAGAAHIEVDVRNDRTRSIVLDAVERARAGRPDLVIASLHWGPNMVETPSDDFRTFARWLIDSGVDVIYGHSAHVFHGIEVYEGSPILYDTGDFVDDYAVDARLRNDRSFLFRLAIDRDGTVSHLRLIPTEIQECTVRRAGPDTAEWSRKRMRSLSEPFGTTYERSGDDLVLELA